MKKFTCFALSVLLSLSFCIPAAAAEDYGVIYDETEQLGSESLQHAGEVTLPALTEQYGVDLRVDILTKSDYDTVFDAAEGIYEKYGYGYGEYHSGITLTLLLQPYGDGYTLAEDDWCVYLGGTDENLLYGDWLYDLTEVMEPYLSEESGAWSGDMDVSAVALSHAVNMMAKFVEDLFGSGDGSYGMTEESFEQDAESSDSILMNYIFDISDLLPFDQWQELEQRAGNISQRYSCGVYAVLVDDYEDYGSGDVYDVTTQIYHSGENSFGMGSGQDGIMILLSMEDRDYAMFVYGKNAEYAFNKYGQEQLEGCFLGDFGNDDWYGGISHYLDACDEYLAKADAGHPVRANPWWGIGLMVFLSCLVALAICVTLRRKLNNVREKVQANEYITPGGLRLADSYDRYTHTTKTRTKIEREGSDGGGHTSSRSGGGGSGRSGKF